MERPSLEGVHEGTKTTLEWERSWEYVSMTKKTLRKLIVYYLYQQAIGELSFLVAQS